MCTVTLVKNNRNGFILTSNRDEAIGRKTLPIDFYTISGKELLFPKDEVAGGTWISVSNEQTMICLLNGGYQNHTKKDNYRHSRGVVVTDILSQGNLKESMQNYNCKNLEPFTLVGVDWSNSILFYELVWDGTTKHFQVLDSNDTHIWSSSTLYTNEMKQHRRDWLSEYKSNHELTPENIAHFHKTGGIGNSYFDLKIKRGNLQTRSITQVVGNETNVKMSYEDLIENQIFEKNIETVNI